MQAEPVFETTCKSFALAPVAARILCLDSEVMTCRNIFQGRSAELVYPMCGQCKGSHPFTLDLHCLDSLWVDDMCPMTGASAAEFAVQWLLTIRHFLGEHCLTELYGDLP